MSRPFQPVEVDALILQAEKPSRYVGGEVNSIRKDLHAAEVTWALAFPDTYEVGMSNLGFRVLYHVLNRRPEVACERVFLPWPDLSEALTRANKPLFTLESRAPVRDFDVLGITLQFELCYTSVLSLLQLSGIPLLTADRTPDDPIVIGGGPCAHSPEPIAPFFDAFVVGEGDEVVHEVNALVRAWKESGGTRAELHWELAEIKGVYVPSLFRFEFERGGPIRAIEALKPGYDRVVRRVIPDLNAAPFTSAPIVPFMQTVHDRIPIEIQRGCTRGCRFCQVGMITRPTRQRDPHLVRELAEIGLKNSGYEEVSFLSLSAGDYQCLNGMLEDFFDRWGPEKISVGIPSLRTETMNARLAEQIRRVRKGGFTVAPEAGSERLRRVINKGNEEKHLLHAVETIFGAGWSLVKFYFMIGLPTERDDDVRAIVDLSKRALEVGRKYTQKASINVGVSTFVPKPFTPFQWEPHVTLDETRRRHQLLRDAAGPRGGAIDLKYHEAEGSRVEAGLCLGDRRAATAVLHAFRNGARLDGWSEHFQYPRWVAAFDAMEAEHGVGLDFFAHREKGRDEILPWDVIDAEVSKSHLWKEREQAHHEGGLVDCAIDHCTVCDACDYEVVQTRVYDPREYIHEDGRPYDLRLAPLTKDAGVAPRGPEVELHEAGARLPVVGPGVSGFRAWEKDDAAPASNSDAFATPPSNQDADDEPSSNSDEEGAAAAAAVAAADAVAAAAADAVAAAGSAAFPSFPLGAPPNIAGPALRRDEETEEAFALRMTRRTYALRERHFARVRWTKTGRAVAISHLETMTMFARAFRRASLAVVFTEGFSPKPRLSFGPALPVGVGSLAEYFDAELTVPVPPAELRERLNATLPEGFTIGDVSPLPKEALSLQDAITQVTWRAALPALAAEALTAAADRFRAATSVPVQRELPAKKPPKGRGRRDAQRAPRVRTLELKELVPLVEPCEGGLRFSVRAGQETSARPGEVLAALLPGATIETTLLVKESVTFG